MVQALPSRVSPGRFWCESYYTLSRTRIKPPHLLMWGRSARLAYSIKKGSPPRTPLPVATPAHPLSLLRDFIPGLFRRAGAPPRGPATGRGTIPGGRMAAQHVARDERAAPWCRTRAGVRVRARRPMGHLEGHVTFQPQPRIVHLTVA